VDVFWAIAQAKQKLQSPISSLARQLLEQLVTFSLSFCSKRKSERNNYLLVLSSR
jgi:hypothetical protein